MSEVKGEGASASSPDDLTDIPSGWHPLDIMVRPDFSRPPEPPGPQPYTRGIVEAHYLHCPHCHGYADLKTHRCSTCGAEAIGILWGEPERELSPELVMVERTR